MPNPIDPMAADIGYDADTGREWTPRRRPYYSHILEDEGRIREYLNRARLRELQAEHKRLMEERDADKPRD